MHLLVTVFKEALGLILDLQSPIWPIVLFSLEVACTAILLALLAGVPLGAFLALRVFPGRKQAATLFQAGMGLPPVLVGLLISLLFWPAGGPLGSLSLLHTPAALILTQAIIILPIVAGFTVAGIRQLNPKLVLHFKALGATPRQLVLLTLWEIRFTLVGAVLVSAGWVLSEVGAAWMTGGNLPGATQVMATAIAGETARGNLGTALAFGLVLLMAVVLLGLVLAIIYRRERKHEYGY